MSGPHTSANAQRRLPARMGGLSANPEGVRGVAAQDADARRAAPAADNAISSSTAYDYRDEAIAVLAARKPGLHGVLLAAKAAGHTHVMVDGTLIHPDRIHTPGPTAGVDVWWSGKHEAHGGNIQVVSAPDGWPLWTSNERPGREHDTNAARAHPALLQRITEWVDDGRLARADLGYEAKPTPSRSRSRRPPARN
jgi:hypothetical protein